MNIKKNAAEEIAHFFSHLQVVRAYTGENQFQTRVKCYVILYHIQANIIHPHLICIFHCE